MTTLREAAQQALEALEFVTLDFFMLNPISPGRESTIKAITALRAALAEPVLEQPVCDECGKSKRDGWALYCVDCLEPMFAQRKPLTDEEILSVLRLAPPEPSLWPHLKDEAVVGDVQKAVLAIARAIERAHGIGGQDEP